MIEVLTPYLLILLGWNDLSPAETMTISQHLYVSEQACMKAGAERMKIIDADRQRRAKMSGAEQVKAEANKFFCVRQLQDIQKYRPLLDDQKQNGN